MTLPEIGTLWVWFLLVGTLAIGFGNTNTRAAFRNVRRGWREPHPEPAEELHGLRDAEGRFGRLIRSGFRSAAVTIRHKELKHHLEFKKYVRGPGQYGIELILPTYKWVQDLIPEVKEYCDAFGLTYRIRPKRTPRAREVLFVDCGRNPEVVVALFRAVWIDIFGIDRNAPIRIDQHGISPHGELVDRPDQKPMSFRKAWRYQREQEGDGGTSLIGCAASLLWQLSRPVVFIGLMVSVLFAQDGTAEWTTQIAEVRLGGSTESLIFLILYLFNITIGRVFSRRLDRRDSDLAPAWERALSTGWGWGVRITLPIAVVLNWSMV